MTVFAAEQEQSGGSCSRPRPQKQEAAKIRCRLLAKLLLTLFEWQLHG